MKAVFAPVVTLLLCGLLAACSQADQADPAPVDAAPAAAAPAAQAPDADAHTAQDQAADAPATPAAPVAAQPPQGPAPVAGTDYVEIDNGQPYQPLNGQIEVVEVFGYTCPACAGFEPLISAWKQRQPADVRVTPVAAPFGGYWMPYAKAYYAAETLGLVDATHQAMFEAIHLQRSLPVQGVSNQQIAAFYARHGADAQQFTSTMDGFAVSGRLRRAQQFVARAGVEATPTMIVNGKYRVVSGRGFDEVLRITDHLVARERAAAAPAAPAAAE